MLFLCYCCAFTSPPKSPEDVKLYYKINRVEVKEDTVIIEVKTRDVFELSVICNGEKILKTKTKYFGDSVNLIVKKCSEYELIITGNKVIKEKLKISE